MSKLPIFFSSQTHFKQQFTDGLQQLLHKPNLGSYILALANSTLSANLFESLQQPLKHQFDQFQDMLFDAMAQGTDPQIADDDLMVFLKLALLGFDNLGLAEQRSAKQWQIHFNHLRAFKPQRMTTQAAPPLEVPFNKQGFHFDKPFLKKEALWEGECLNKNISLFYNKYPFTDFHCLLIPEKEQHHPQYLTETLHHYIFHLVEQLSAQFGHAKLGYNAMGALASVNHCHFQLCLPLHPFPIELTHWSHNGGQTPYPTKVERFTSATLSWQYISDLHNSEQAYNLLYTTDGCYIMPRRSQGTYQTVNWSSGFTWFELSGAMITFNRAHYDEISATVIKSSLQTLDLSQSPTVNP
ncbi:MAG: hypothetical protein HOM11_02025 [Methylococcales bacterium]|nr:hypothetical protein [Methylococcales bacterium]